VKEKQNQAETQGYLTRFADFPTLKMEEKHSSELKLGCLHPVAYTRSGSAFPSNATIFE
jgi:hypothetical protein